LRITSTCGDEISDFPLISPYELMTEKLGNVALGVKSVPNCDVIG